MIEENILEKLDEAERYRIICAQNGNHQTVLHLSVEVLQDCPGAIRLFSSLLAPEHWFKILKITDQYDRKVFHQLAAAGHHSYFSDLLEPLASEQQLEILDIFDEDCKNSEDHALENRHTTTITEIRSLKKAAAETLIKG